MYFGPVTINLFSFKVNAIDHSAIVNLGPSKHLDIYVAYKRSQGIGEQNGDLSPIIQTYSAVSDNDLTDNPSIKNSIL